MDNQSTIQNGDVEIMSAATGIVQSEYNKDQNREVQFLPIWAIPNKNNVEPRYDRISISGFQTRKELHQILSLTCEDDGLWIYQEAWFHRGIFGKNKTRTYAIKKSGNGVYTFVIKGGVKISGENLGLRDAIRIWDTHAIQISGENDSRILIIDAPMIC